MARGVRPKRQLGRRMVAVRIFLVVADSIVMVTTQVWVVRIRTMVEPDTRQTFAYFDEIEMVPRSPVVMTDAPLAFHRSTTSACGWPKGDERPTEITAVLAPTASINS